MKLKEMEILFDEYSENEYLEFNKVENKLSNRPDLHAFILLDKLVPGNSDLICSSAHDEFYLGVDEEDFSKIVTKEIILELVRCGVRYSRDEGFCMFA